MELKCSIQNYSWGKCGTNSMVALLKKSSDENFTLNENEAYAELWMGIHPSGPSFLKDNNISLEKYLHEKSNVLGTASLNTYGVTLPFLFKVLSVKKALSIQIHPNKEQAEKLHRAQPEIYKDSNHKPEMAIALSPFQALCGFRPISEIKNYMRSIPELQIVIGRNQITRFFLSDEINQQNSLSECFASLMAQESEIIIQQLRKLHEKLSNLDQESREIMNANLFEQLYSDYPGDVGCFCIYFFNYIKLQPGEAIYVGADEPHAYLFGDCIECMASSDNVVRAGLTPRMKDIETLVDMVSYKCEAASAKTFQATKEDEFTEVFRPPIQDFAVAKITIPSGELSYEFIKRESASILIVINGKATYSSSKNLGQGTVLFIPADESIKINVHNNPMLLFQAFVNI